MDASEATHRIDNRAINIAMGKPVPRLRDQDDGLSTKQPHESATELLR
jgi:hypothetical protein